jgi:hypothetical protein
MSFHAAADERRYFVLEPADTYAQRKGESAGGRNRPASSLLRCHLDADAGGWCGGHAVSICFVTKASRSSTRVCFRHAVSRSPAGVLREPHEQWWTDRLERGGGWFETPPSKAAVFQDWGE